jgi:hypothetical protein
LSKIKARKRNFTPPPPLSILNIDRLILVKDAVNELIKVRRKMQQNF